MRIGLDLDGTIVDTYAYWLTTLQQTPLAGRFRLVDLLDHHNDPDLFAYVERNVEAMFGQAPVIPGALQALRYLRKQGHDLLFVSARGSDLREVTESWLTRHSLPMDRLFLLAGGDKAALCQAEGISLMVEDSPAYTPVLANSGIQVWLRDTEYNREVNGPRIRRFAHWSEIAQVGALQALA